MDLTKQYAFPEAGAWYICKTDEKDKWAYGVEKTLYVNAITYWT